MRQLVGLILSSLLAAGTVVSAGDIAERRQGILDAVEQLSNREIEMSESERLQKFFDLYYDYAMLEFPEFATFIGHPEGHDRWTDNSIDAIRRREGDTSLGLRVLESFDRSKLLGIDRLNYDLIHQNIKDTVDGQKFDDEYLTISQLGGPQQNVAQMLAMMPASTPGQIDAILGRLYGVSELIDNSIELMRLGLDKGVTPPKITLRDVPQQVLNVIPEDPMQSALLRAFAQLPDSIPADEQKVLTAKAVDTYENRVTPAFKRLHSFLTDRYLPGARDAIAMGALPQGKEWYAYQVRQMTTTELTPEQIHEIGLSEVKRIRAAMDEVIAESGFEGSFEEFTEFLRTDPRFYFDEGEALLTTYRDISKRADAELIKLFGHLPRLPYGVIPVPSYAEKSQTTAYYQPGSIEAGRPGYFFANTYDLKTRPKWEMEALTLHEAVPGHHLQIAIQMELEDIPWWRRFGGYTAFVEGWGLYSESLGEEMGFYQDPYSRFGQLTYEMWRAIRLVVDTGMHQLGWTRDQAIDFFKKNTGKTEHDIVVEVDRYIVMPAQALAYKIGELKLKELRAYATKELGNAFDLRAFHDELLGNGALPLSVLETHIREWVELKKSQSASAGAAGAGAGGP